jgi:tetratricopeptide (TPR) repeat protein
VDAGERPATRIVAFYAHTDGTGRSCLTANVALILASAGYRVLVVDLDRLDPALDRYLSAFLPATGAQATTPVRLDCQFTAGQGTVEFLGPADGNADGPQPLVDRAGLMRLEYDLVLIDTPAGSESVQLTGDLADVLVLGYGLNKAAIDRADEHAKAVRGGPRGDQIQILPVPMRVDARAAVPNARALPEARLRFAGLLAGTPAALKADYWDAIRIPYEPDHASEEGLPFLDDPSEQATRLVEAYERLASLLVPPGTAWAGSSRATDETRARYQAARPAAEWPGVGVRVVHAPEDRYWGEWLAAELQGMGLVASRQRIDRLAPGDVSATLEMLVVSRYLLTRPDLAGYLSARSVRPAAGTIPIGVSVDGADLPGRPSPVMSRLDLSDLDAKEVHEKLIFLYQAVNPGATPYGRLHYPSAIPGVFALPYREGGCYGRDDEIDQIRDHFLFGPNPAPLTLTGAPGIGKSHLALEYAYRFAAHYDIVFRIQADSVEAVRAGLTELAKKAQPDHQDGDAGLSALRELGGAQSPRGKWLLILDGVPSAGVLLELQPLPSHGHILVTARVPVDGLPATLPVPALPAEPAAAMLTELGTPPDLATEIATALQGVPLALSLAAGWIEGVQDQLLGGGITPATVIVNAAHELARQRSTAVAAATVDEVATADPVETMVGLLVDLLERSPDNYGRAALLLLNTCAFLAPTGLSRRLRRSPEMLEQLRTADTRISDAVVVHNVVRTIVRSGLTLRKEMPADALQVHPRVLELIRERMTPSDRALREADVTRMLAASAPPNIDDDVLGDSAFYAELLPHVRPSGAMSRPEISVCRWLVSQVRYLWQLNTMSDWRMARELAEELVERWAVKAPSGHNNPLLLRLRTQLANICRSLGDFNDAMDVDRDVLDRQRALLGVSHLRTLMTARSYGADLRLAGDFEGALLEDQSTWQGFAHALGDDHLMTIIASANLALSDLLFGEPEQALDRVRADRARSQRISQERPWQEASLLFRIGTLQRELGLYDASHRSLLMATRQYDDLVGKGLRASSDRDVLHTTASLAITNRRRAEPDIGTTRRVLAEYVNAYGSVYPDVFGIILSLAGDLHATQQHTEAVRQAQHAHEACRSIFGPGHPFTGICEVDLSIYALTAGDREIAGNMSASALSSLQQALAPGHPWIRAAAVARANTLVAAGRMDEALPLEEQALAEYEPPLGSHNQLKSLIEINAANTRKLLKQPALIRHPEEGWLTRRAIELDIPPY